MRPSDGFRQRLFRAIRYFEAETGEKLHQATLGDMVASELGDPVAVPQTTVSGWIHRGVRDVDVIWGIARALSIDFNWLALGEGEMRLAGAAPRRPIAYNPAPRPTLEEGLAAVRAMQAQDQEQQRPAVKGGARRRPKTG